MPQIDRWSSEVMCAIGTFTNMTVQIYVFNGETPNFVPLIKIIFIGETNGCSSSAFAPLALDFYLMMKPKTGSYISML